MRHIISILLENEAGALSRVAGLFSARGYNIQSLTVAPTEDPSLSRMTLVTTGPGDHIEREMLLIKLQAVGEARTELKRLVDIFRGRIIDVTPNTYTVELTGTGEKLDPFMHSLGGAATP